MKNIIVNAFAVDCRNIGDLASSPTKYFDFPYPVESLDIRSIDPHFPEPKSGFGGTITLDEIKKNADQVKYHLIVGGGGLLFKQFLGSFQTLEKLKSIFTGKWILWGAGQQIYPSFKSSEEPFIDRLKESQKTFNYGEYVKNFDLIGIRDYGFNYNWLPCVSCMDTTFDKKREIKHDFVVFSHRKFRLKIDNFPHTSHDTQSLEEVINFLASGETILTSSYHGAYWGTLLGRRVIAFPFSTKFLTFKHEPSIYPVSQWQNSHIKFRPFKRTFLNKIKLEFGNPHQFTCPTKHWRNLLTTSSAYPNLIKEYRQVNQEFYHKAKELFKD